jgi:hypothetical protein
MTANSIDVYLGRLQRALRGHTFISRRVTDEAREHLRDAVEAGVQRGLSIEAATREALRRFGDPAQIGGEFLRVYRWEATAWYLAKIALSVIASVAAALAVQVLINLRIALQTEALRLAPGFSPAALISVAVVVGLAAAWEIARRPFDGRRAMIAVITYAAICVATQWAFALGWRAFGPATLLVVLGYLCARFEQRPVRLAIVFVAFSVLLYAAHVGMREVFGAGQALIASASLLAVWTATIGILTRFDRAFLDTVKT